jgi:hypothetical protein
MDDLADAIGIEQGNVVSLLPSKPLLLYDIYRRAASVAKSITRLDPSHSPRHALHRCTVNLLRFMAKDSWTNFAAYPYRLIGRQFHLTTCLLGCRPSTLPSGLCITHAESALIGGSG